MSLGSNDQSKPKSLGFNFIIEHIGSSAITYSRNLDLTLIQTESIRSGNHA